MGLPRHLLGRQVQHHRDLDELDRVVAVQHLAENVGLAQKRLVVRRPSRGVLTRVGKHAEPLHGTPVTHLILRL